METKIRFDYEDYSDKVLLNLENKMPEILMAMGTELHKVITDFMTDNDIVDTGRLRGSISFSTPYTNYNKPDENGHNTTDDFIRDVKEKDTVVYGSNVPYASFVNDGTTKQKARKFIQTGTYRAVPKIKKVVEEILKGEK